MPKEATAWLGSDTADHPGAGQAGYTLHLIALHLRCTLLHIFHSAGNWERYVVLSFQTSLPFVSLSVICVMTALLHSVAA